MNSKILTRVIILAMVLLLMTVVIVGVLMLQKQMQKNAAQPNQIETVEMAEGEIMGPFILRVTYPKVGGQQYTSFNVYYRHDGNEELWFSCGRMFNTAQVQSIAWADEQFNIVVTLRDGRQELFSYDGNSDWR